MALAYAPSARAQAEAEDGGFYAIEAEDVPAEVERIVRFRALGFGQDRPFGGSIEVSALADSNIERATRADATGTVISDLVPPEFTLAGKAGSPGAGLLPGEPGEDGLPSFENGTRSALGASLRGQAYWRRQLNNEADLLVRASASGEIYGDSRFNDLALSLQAGPEYAVGSDRIAVFAGPAWRWYGAEPYSLALGGGASWQHPLARRAQLRVEVAAARVDNRRDDLLDGGSFSLTAELDRVLAPGSGVGAQVLLIRETAREPGYATTRGALTLHAFHAVGATTFIVTLGYGRLEADRQLAFFPQRRIDDRFTASLAATLGGLRLGPAAPLVRLNWERNRSSVPFYDFRRVAAEFGLVAAF